jgi:hypothetical protein
MRSALYYPHTQLHQEGSERLLKHALLLWDELEFIVPHPDYQLSHENPLFARAMALIGRPHCPSDDENPMGEKQSGENSPHSIHKGDL